MGKKIQVHTFKHMHDTEVYTMTEWHQFNLKKNHSNKTEKLNNLQFQHLITDWSYTIPCIKK